MEGDRKTIMTLFGFPKKRSYGMQRNASVGENIVLNMWKISFVFGKISFKKGGLAMFETIVIPLDGSATAK
jgi:hypothetical protein